MELLASLHFLMAHSAFLQILNQTPRSLPDTTGNWKLQTSILSLTHSLLLSSHLLALREPVGGWDMPGMQTRGSRGQFHLYFSFYTGSGRTPKLQI